MGARESQTYYHTVAELPTLKAAELHQRIRVGGDVATGSIQHLQGRVDFVLKAEGKTLAVSYVGKDPLPDTFKDGAQALADGKLGTDGLRSVGWQRRLLDAGFDRVFDGGDLAAFLPDQDRFAERLAS